MILYPNIVLFSRACRRLVPELLLPLLQLLTVLLLIDLWRVWLRHEHMRRGRHRLLLTRLICVQMHGQSLHPLQNIIEVCGLRRAHLVVVRLILIIGQELECLVLEDSLLARISYHAQ